jgi:hypothetical protein
MGSACIDSVRLNLVDFTPEETSAMEASFANLITVERAKKRKRDVVGTELSPWIISY